MEGRKCIICGDSLDGMRRDAKYCKHGCRQVNYRKTKPDARKTRAKIKWPTESESFLAAHIHALAESTTRLVSGIAGMSPQEALPLLIRQLGRVQAGGQMTRVQRICQLDAEQLRTDPNAYYRRTGMF